MTVRRTARRGDERERLSTMTMTKSPIGCEALALHGEWHMNAFLVLHPYSHNDASLSCVHVGFTHRAR